jgi:hypothetical protein
MNNQSFQDENNKILYPYKGEIIDSPIESQSFSKNSGDFELLPHQKN